LRILYISKDRSKEDLIRSNLEELSEHDSIRFAYSYSEAAEFIENFIIGSQALLDLIISESNIQRQSASDFKERIQKDRERTFSNRDFKFHSIPVILIADKEENRNAYLGLFDNAVDDIGTEKLHLFQPEMVGSVKTWRRQVLDELENIGFNQYARDARSLLLKKNLSHCDTDILSENFKLFPRNLNYSWLTENDHQIEQAIDEYIKEFKRLTVFKRKKEKKIHQIFNKNPFLIKRDNYSKHWYEPKLYLNNTNYYEPDYMLEPNFNYRTDLSLLEIKLPSERFIKKKLFHPSPYAALMEHIFQVNDYKDYIESDQYQDQLFKAFGFVPNKIEYNILVGRSNDKEKNLSIFNNRLRQINALHINFITYDELYEYQVKFLERFQLLDIN